MNRRGFTLIELLAVVVIMGIILVVTIPSVINTTKMTKEKQLKNAANTVADWYTKQYELDSLGMGAADEEYKFKPNVVNYEQSRPFYLNSSSADPPNADRKSTLEAAGVSDVDANFVLAESRIVLNGKKVCVILTAKDKGAFYTTNGVNKKCSSTCKHGFNGSEEKGFECKDEYF